MTLAMHDRDKVIAQALRGVSTDVEQSALGRWRFVLRNGKALAVNAHLAD